MPKALRWAVLKAADGKLTTKQAVALAELEATDLFTATAWRIKLRWIRKADGVHAARWRITNFIRQMHRWRSPLGAGQKSARNLRKAPRSHPSALDVKPQQRPHGGPQRSLPSRSGKGTRIPKHRHLHHHDLPDRRPARKPLRFHLKRRRTKNKITRRWAPRGTRPRAPRDQRTKSAYIFGAICPARGVGAALVLPRCNTQAMQWHLDEISSRPQAPTPSSSPTRPGGIPRPSSRSRPTSRFCSCRQGRPS